MLNIRLRHSVSHKILAAVVGISAFFTLLTTIVIAYADYRTELNQLDKKFVQIETSFLSALVRSVWTVDEVQIGITLQSITHLSDIEYVAIFENDGSQASYAKGQKPDSGFKMMSFPLKQTEDGDEQTIGRLDVYASMTEINNRIIQKAVFLIVSQSMKTILASVFIIMMINLLATNHLKKMTTFFNRFNPKEEKNQKLTLTHRSSRYADEIDFLSDSINKMAENLQDLYRNMENKIQKRTRQLSEKTNDIKSMLQNMQLGVFTLIDDNKIHKEYSQYLKLIFEQDDLAGKDGIDLICQGSDLSGDQIDQTRAAVSNMIGEHILSFEINEHLLPREIVRKVAGHKRILEIDWQAIADNQGDHITKMMVIIRDVTKLRDLEIEAQKQREELVIIGHLLQNKPQQNHKFTNNLMTLSADVRKELHKTDTQMEALYRLVHTLKGNARAAGYLMVSAAAHELEDHIDLMTKQQKIKGGTSALQKSYEAMSACIEKYMEIYQTKLSTVVSEKRSDGHVMENSLKKCLNIVKNVDIHSDANVRQALAEISMTLQHTGYIDLRNIVSDLRSGLKSVAQSLGKPTPQIQVIGQGVRLSSGQEATLMAVLNHCFRNTIDHGIESPEDRRKKHKPEQGLIQIKVMEDAGRMLFMISDDGRGLNLKKIREKALEKNLISDGASNLELAQTIFSGKLTTAQSVTDVSGRGIGMNAVKTFLEEKGGEIAVGFDGPMSSEGFQPFFFRIVFPCRDEEIFRCA